MESSMCLQDVAVGGPQLYMEGEGAFPHCSGICVIVGRGSSASRIPEALAKLCHLICNLLYVHIKVSYKLATNLRSDIFVAGSPLL